MPFNSPGTRYRHQYWWSRKFSNKRSIRASPTESIKHLIIRPVTARRAITSTISTSLCLVIVSIITTVKSQTTVHARSTSSSILQNRSYIMYQRCRPQIETSICVKFCYSLMYSIFLLFFASRTYLQNYYALI